MHHKQGAYDGFDALAEVQPHYKRCRHTKHFILSEAGVETDKPVCAVCKKAIENKAILRFTGNRGEYSPKTKMIKIMHYYCAWVGVMEEIIKLHND